MQKVNKSTLYSLVYQQKYTCKIVNLNKLHDLCTFVLLFFRGVFMWVILVSLIIYMNNSSNNIYIVHKYILLLLLYYIINYQAFMRLLFGVHQK